jgi:hypothetical protein
MTRKDFEPPGQPGGFFCLQCLIRYPILNSMDKNKWKSVVVLTETHSKIKDIAHFQKLPLNQSLEWIVNEKWESIFVQNLSKPVQPTDNKFRSRC